MLEGGYIKLYRSLLSWEWYDDPNTLRVFLHLLLTVNHEEKLWHGITVSRGQRVCSFAGLARETGLTLQQTKTAVAHLQSTGEITHSSTRKYSIFTVENYGKFQGAAYSRPTERPTANRRSTTMEERQEREKKETEPHASRPDVFAECAGSNGELLRALRKFEEMRNKSGKPMTEYAKRLLVGKLEKFSAGYRDAERYRLECLERSILGGYQGVFPLKEFEDGPPPPQDVPAGDNPVRIDLEKVSWEDLAP